MAIARQARAMRDRLRRWHRFRRPWRSRRSGAMPAQPGPAAATRPCKLCAAPARVAFGLPRSKRTGHPIPDEPDDCWYYQCSSCQFLFTDARDRDDHTQIYDDTYWTTQDPDWYGRVGETMRLVLLANELLQRPSDELEILDFGCGSGGFVEIGRRNLHMNVWGTDIIEPRVGRDYFLPALGSRTFDIITACEVIEHLPDPRATFDAIRAHLKSPGVLAFQTAYWDPQACDRAWWYLGPHNGHISLYSSAGLDHLFTAMRGTRRRLWRNYPGLQAWLFA